MTDPNTTTTSIPLSELSLEQLVQLSQGLGRQIDALREQRAYLKAKIDERLANGERTASDVGVINASAPGAVIDVSAAT
jgi:hypothetical protein